MNMDIVMAQLRAEANSRVIQEIKDGKITLDDEEGVLPPFLAANLITNPQLLDILEAMAGLIMSDMEKEYVVFFINKIREIANKEMSF